MACLFTESQDDVYVRRFPEVNSGGPWRITPNGGDDPIWSRDGRELFYRGAGGGVVAVPVETDPTFRPGTSDVLFSGPYREGGGVQYDVALDGRQFLMIKEAAYGGEAVGTHPDQCRPELDRRAKGQSSYGTIVPYRSNSGCRPTDRQPTHRVFSRAE